MTSLTPLLMVIELISHETYSPDEHEQFKKNYVNRTTTAIIMVIYITSFAFGFFFPLCNCSL